MPQSAQTHLFLRTSTANCFDRVQQESSFPACTTRSTAFLTTVRAIRRWKPYKRPSQTTWAVVRKSKPWATLPKACGPVHAKNVQLHHGGRRHRGSVAAIAACGGRGRRHRRRRRRVTRHHCGERASTAGKASTGCRQAVRAPRTAPSCRRCKSRRGVRHPRSRCAAGSKVAPAPLHSASLIWATAARTGSARLRRNSGSHRTPHSTSNSATSVRGRLPVENAEFMRVMVMAL